MSYNKKPVTKRITLSACDEPDFYIEVAHPESMKWKVKSQLIAAAQRQDLDDVTRSLHQMVALIVDWNLLDADTDERLPVSVDAFDRVPSHVVECIVSEVGQLFNVPKSGA